MIRLKRISSKLIESISRFPKKRSFLESLKASGIIVLLKGARGTGKTTAILQYLNQERQKGTKCLYISADSVLLADMNLVDVAESFTSEGGQLLAIDEIHKKEDWAKNLKTIFDSFCDLKVVASGSSSIQLSKADLSRRAIKINCYGLSFREWLNITYDLELEYYSVKEIIKNHSDLVEDIIKPLKANKISVIDAFKRYLKTGYFPTSFDLDEWVYYETLNESIQKTIEQDILSCYPELSGKSTQKLKKCLAIIAAKCPYVPNINDLTTALEISDQKSTKKYLYYLHEAHILREIAKQGKTVSSLSKAEKIYLDNTNYLYALTRQMPDIGTVRETFMSNTLSVFYQSQDRGEIHIPKRGDFVTDDGYIFEVGGRSKGFKQIMGEKKAFIVSDDIEYGEGYQLPLWLFGFLW